MVGSTLMSGWMPTLMEARGNGFGTSFSFGALLEARADVLTMFERRIAKLEAEA